jgi:3-deoxy-D-manno-octulosonic-acid transferase
LRYLYSLLLYLLVPFVILRLLWRSLRAPAYRRRWAERFGFFPRLPVTGAVWVHAVSVGEVQAALPLIAWLRQDRQVAVLVTTTTVTGSERVRQQLADQVFHVYTPYDLPGAVRRFLRRVRPSAVIIMETEIWPNLFHRCRAAGIPLILANARLSAPSAQGYRRVRGLTWSTLRNVTELAAQARPDADRFISLGMDAQHVHVTGNIKFDVQLPAELRARAEQLRREWGERRPVWVAASTHAGEEELILSAFDMVQRRLPQALLVLVPRHPERFDKVADLCQRRGYVVARRSARGAVGTEVAVFLGDTMGELPLFYAGADVAFVGGSLVPTGGHNVLEPAAQGVPVVVGPHTFNFLEITRALIGHGGGERVETVTELATVVVRLLENAKLRDATGSCGRELVERNRGAMAKLEAVLIPYLPASDTLSRGDD